MSVFVLKCPDKYEFALVFGSDGEDTKTEPRLSSFSGIIFQESSFG
jgi:hypothetical protein